MNMEILKGKPCLKTIAPFVPVCLIYQLSTTVMEDQSLLLIYLSIMNMNS